MKEALRDIDNLGVVEAQLGYSDDRQSWFVSKWEELESNGFAPNDAWVSSTPNDYGEFEPLVRKKNGLTYRDPAYLERIVVPMEKEIEKRARAIGIRISDLRPNLFYNPDTERFFLLDVTGNK